MSYNIQLTDAELGIIQNALAFGTKLFDRPTSKQSVEDKQILIEVKALYDRFCELERAGESVDE